MMMTLTLKKPPPKQIGRLNLSSSAFSGSVRQPAQLSLKFESNLQIGVGPLQLTSKTTYGSRHRPDVPPETHFSLFYLSSEWWSAFRPNCTALTILTSSCLEVWTGPLPGSKMEMMMMTKQKNKSKKKTKRLSFTNSINSRSGAWIGSSPTAGEVWIWKLRILFTSLNYYWSIRNQSESNDFYGY